MEVLWRCRHCGKWSTAKRDPIAHKRWHHLGPEKWRGWFVWCGPFDRWAATPNEGPNPRRDLPHLGQPVSPMERESALHPVALDPEAAPF